MGSYRSWQGQSFIRQADHYGGLGEYGSHFDLENANILDQHTLHDFEDGPSTEMDFELSSSAGSDLYQSPCTASPLSTTFIFPESQHFLPHNELGHWLAWDYSQCQPGTLYPHGQTQDLQRRICNSPDPLQTGHEPYMSTKETERKLEKDVQRRECSHCGQWFDGLRSLEEHARRESHKAWRCSDCGKRYSLRTTYQRHRATHKEGTHSCVRCERIGKRKVFKRKDHLTEHVRNCHAGSSDAASTTTEAQRFSDLVNMSIADNNGDCDLSGSPLAFSTATSPASLSEEEKSTPKQQQAMKHIVRSLGDVLGRRHQKLIGSLENLESSLNAMSGAKMESVAEGMAELALVKTLLAKDSDYSCSKA
ncbi:hypothetical protein Q7P37_001497 [Cladosporium fusiforme]